MSVFALAACNNGNKSNPGNNPDSLNDSVTGRAIIADSTALFETEWSLLEVNDSLVVLDTTFRSKPFLKFKEIERTASGNLGCNGFGTSFEFNGTDGITFSAITATEMACPNLKVEQSFLEALKNTDKYEVSDGILTLKSSDGNVLAKLSR